MALGDITKSEGKVATSIYRSPRNEAANLDQSVRQLEERIKKITDFKARSAAVTLIHICMAMAFAVFVLIAPPTFGTFWPSFLIIFCFLSIFGMLYATLMVIGFDASRRAGNDLYSEISDTFQSGVSSVKSKVRQQLLRDLKRWLRASDMPLVPGPYGPAVYLLLNILATVGVFVIAFTHK